jgi:hypothetical protein
MLRATWAGHEETKGDTSKPVRINVVALPTSALVRSNTATWTFMVYMAADNDLGGVWDLDNLNQMKEVGSTSNINIVVLLDTAPNPVNFTKILYITPGGVTVAKDYKANLDTGNPATLTDFIKWTIANYPAQHYLLDLWGHGSGFISVCSDDTSGDSLNMIELKSSIAGVGTRFDIIGFDACLMGMTEVFYQMRGWADYFVASEETVPGAGWPYKWILGNLTGNPFWEPSKLATEIVEKYSEKYSEGVPTYTMAAAETSQSSNLANSVSSFGIALESGMPAYRSQIGYSFDHSEYFAYSFFIDLYDFADLIRQNSTIADPDIISGAGIVMSNVASSIIYERHGSGHADSHGLSIYGEYNQSRYLAGYDILDLSSDTFWHEFIRAYLGLAHSGSVLDASSDIVGADENTLYFVYPNYAGAKPPGVVYAWLSDWTALGFIAGMCSKTQHEVTDTNPAVIDTGTGEVRLQNTTVVLFGGPAVDAPVHYYEQNRIAPLYWQNDGGTYYFYKANGSRLDATNLTYTQMSSGHNLFVVESFTDNSGNRVYIFYGYGWKGTFAAGKFFKFIMYPDISSYTNSYYIFRWDDNNQDGFVDLNEISTTPVATG